MSQFCSAAGMLLVLALATVLTGRAVAALLGVRILRRMTPETAAASAVLGTAVWALVAGWCSFAGMTAPATLPVAATAAAALCLGLVLARRLDWLWPRGLAKTWAIWLAVLVMGGALALLPLAMCRFINPCNDTLNYCLLAERLQEEGAGLSSGPVPTATASDATVLLYWSRSQCWRLGAMFVLALSQTLFAGYSALEVYPAVMAWGVLLNAGASFCLCRWAWRLPRGQALLAPIVLFVVVNPLHFSAHNGFLSQVYGTATMTCALAVVVRVRPQARGAWPAGLVLAVLLAAMISLYSELAPVLLFGMLIHGAWQFKRARRMGRRGAWLTFGGVALLAFVGLANIELVRGVRGVLLQMQSGGGSHIEWSLLQYWAYATGTLPYGEVLKWYRCAGTLVASVLVLLGVGQIIPRRLVSLGACLVLLGAMAAYFRWSALDPWTGETGQTWAQFKLCKWAYPLLNSVEVAGLAVVLRRLPRWAVVVPMVAMVCVGPAWLDQVRQARLVASFNQQGVQTSRVLAELQELRQRRAACAERPVRVLHDNVKPMWPHRLISYLLFPAPCIYPNTASAEARTGFVAGQDYVLMGQPPFGRPLEQLPCGLCRVDASRPLVFGMAPLEEPGTPAAGVRLAVWSPQPGDANLVLTLRAPDNGGDPGCYRVEVLDGNGASATATCVGANARAPVVLPSGTSRLQVRWTPQQLRLCGAELTQ